MTSRDRATRLRRWTAPRVLKLLTIILISGLVLPASWTGWIKSFVQGILPFQRAAQTGLHTIAPGGEDIPESIRADELRALIEARDRYERVAAALQARVAQLEEENATLLASRTDVVGAEGSLIPAALLGEDPARWREHVLLDQGSRSGVARGAPVTTRATLLDAGSAEGVAPAMAVVLGASLIGVVEEAHLLISRVRLVTDPRTQLKVRLARPPGSGLGAQEGEVSDATYWLEGAGDAGMIVREAVRADVEGGSIRIGDIVVAHPVECALPAPIPVGRVARIDPDLKNPLLATLIVHPLVDPQPPLKVYVFKPF